MTLVNSDEISEQLEQAVERHFSGSPLHAAIRYAVIPPGKLLRPRLSATLARELGWAGDLSWTIALEFLHVASLIHDDLPALDNDDFRRGRASLHRKFSEATAILAADALTAAAFACALANDAGGPERVKVLAGAFVALCNGQQLDLQAKSSDRREMIRLKTGALFGACLELAYLTAKSGGPNRQEFRIAGETLGVAFQELDDQHDSNLTTVSGLPASVEQACKLFRSLPGVGQESGLMVERFLKF